MFYALLTLRKVANGNQPFVFSTSTPLALMMAILSAVRVSTNFSLVLLVLLRTRTTLLWWWFSPSAKGALDVRQNHKDCHEKNSQHIYLLGSVLVILSGVHIKCSPPNDGLAWTEATSSKRRRRRWGRKMAEMLNLWWFWCFGIVKSFRVRSSLF